MLLAPERFALIHRKFEEWAAFCPAWLLEGVGQGNGEGRRTLVGVAAMPQFCCRRPDTNLTVQLQIGKEDRALRVSMHNRCT